MRICSVTALSSSKPKTFAPMPSLSGQGHDTAHNNPYLRHSYSSSSGLDPTREEDRSKDRKACSFRRQMRRKLVAFAFGLSLVVWMAYPLVNGNQNQQAVVENLDPLNPVRLRASVRHHRWAIAAWVISDIEVENACLLASSLIQSGSYGPTEVRQYPSR